MEGVKDTVLEAVIELTELGSEHEEFDGTLSASQIFSALTGSTEVKRQSPGYKTMLSNLKGLVENGQLIQGRSSAGLTYRIVEDFDGDPFEETGVYDLEREAEQAKAKSTAKKKAAPKKKTPAKKKPAPKAKEKAPEKLKRKIRKTLVFNDKEKNALNLSKTVLATGAAICEQFEEGCTIGLLVLGLEQHGVVVEDKFEGRGAVNKDGTWITGRNKLSSQLAWHKSKGNFTASGERGRYIYVAPKEEPANEKE